MSWARAFPHPRGYGNNARALGRYVRERKTLSLENAIRKMTSLPAEHFGFTNRGRLVAGQAADVVIFDPARIADRATYEQPHQYPEGISASTRQECPSPPLASRSGL